MVNKAIGCGLVETVLVSGYDVMKVRAFLYRNTPCLI